MILASLYLAALGPVQADPAQLISKMFAYYYDAKSMAGKIKFTQAFQNRVATVDTQFQFEWPAKVYIKQNMTGPAGQDRWLVTGDGEGFSYDSPRIVAEKQPTRLYEPVQYIPPAPKYKQDLVLPKPAPHDVRTIYRAVCLTVGDRSLPLDLAFGRKEDLSYMRGQLATLRYKGEDELNGVKCHVVNGIWKDHPGTDEERGKYELWITEGGELKRFSRSEFVSFKAEQKATAPVIEGEIISVWDVNITKDSGIDPALFKVVMKY